MARKIKMSPSYAGAMGEELIKSGVFTEEEIAKFLWVEFDEGYQRNPEKDPAYKPYKEKTKAKRKKPTVTIDKPDSLVSMKVMTPKESYDAMVESGIFSDIEIQNFIFDDFEESVEHRRNPEKYAEKPYREKSRAERMRDPERGINSPAFKKFMADRGMSV